MDIKKFTQKNADGSSVTYEFNVPPMEAVPHPGSPKGTDTVPAWLTPGEFVVNAEATRMYGPQIEAMNNAGRVVQAYQGGTIPEYKYRGGCTKAEYKAKGGKPCGCAECSGVQYKQQGGSTVPTPIPNQEASFLENLLGAAKKTVQPLVDAVPFINEDESQEATTTLQKTVPAPTEKPPVVSDNGFIPPSQRMPAKPEEKPEEKPKLSYLEKLEFAESTNRPDAESSTSSATGLHQFTEGTWVDIVKKNEPELAASMSESELLELRKDPEVSRRMVGYLTQENKKALEKDGLDTSDGSLYLSHFLGSGNARKTLKAQPNTPIADILPQNVIDANKSVLENKTVGEVKAWAQGKMNNQSGSTPTSTVEKPDETQIAMPQNRNFVPGVRGRGRDQGLPSPTAVQQARDEREEFREDKLQKIRERIADNLPPIHNYTQNDLDRLAKEELERQEGQQEKDFDENFVPASEVDKEKEKPQDPVKPREEMLREIAIANENEMMKAAYPTGMPAANAPKTQDDGLFAAASKFLKGLGGNAGETISKAASGLMDYLKDSGVINQQELSRAALLYLGSRAMGYDHDASLNYSANQYAQRWDARQTETDKMYKEKKFTKESIDAYRSSGDPSVLTAVKKAPKRVSGTPKKYFTKDKNQSVNLFEFETADGSKYLGMKDGTPVNMDAVHNNPEIVPDTKEFNETRRKNTTYVEGLTKELVESTKERNDGKPALGAGSELLSRQVGRWATVNSVSVDDMNKLTTQAYADAVAHSQRTGVPVKDITPFLNQQVLRTYTASPNMLMSKSKDDDGNPIPINPVKFATLNNKIANTIGSTLDDVRVSDIRNQYMALKEKEYMKLSQDERDFYNNRALDDENGFLLFMQEDLKIIDPIKNK